MYTLFHSPIGRLVLCADDKALLGIYFEEQYFEKQYFGKQYFEKQWEQNISPTGNSILQRTATQLEEYFSGRRLAFDIPLELSGTAFQQKVWQSLREIPYGHTWSYREQATRIGHPKAVRAVGSTNGRNPLPIILPCHRVIGTHGKLTGYAGGLERKMFLLELERRVLQDRFSNSQDGAFCESP